jgi:hypothetical protein
MEKEFITYDLALRMKELGFDETCLVYFNNKSNELLFLNEKDISFLQGTSNSTFTKSPTWQSAFKWFRDNYGIHMTPSKYDETQWWVNWGSWTSKVYDSYEEAQKSCLEKLCEIVENIKN